MDENGYVDYWGGKSETVNVEADSSADINDEDEE